MANATFIQSGGAANTVEVADGVNLLEAAQGAGLDGMVGECGGSLSCATCHVYVDDAWLNRLDPISPDEDAMLDCTYCEREPNSRLGCQIRMSQAVDGIVVRLPERQI